MLPQRHGRFSPIWKNLSSSRRQSSSPEETNTRADCCHSTSDKTEDEEGENSLGQNCNGTGDGTACARHRGQDRNTDVCCSEFDRIWNTEIREAWGVPLSLEFNEKSVRTLDLNIPEAAFEYVVQRVLLAAEFGSLALSKLPIQISLT